MACLVRSLAEITRPRSSELGGKGFSLAVLVSRGVAVPPGFVVLSSALRRYLHENGLSAKLRRLCAAIRGSDCSGACGEIRRSILRGKFSNQLLSEVRKHLSRLSSKHVAVRSSSRTEDRPGSSFAGLYDSFLNVPHDARVVLARIRSCWTSLLNQRAVAYKLARGLPVWDDMAVVIQEMVPADHAGVAFTVHPNRPTAILIESTPGPGSLVVGGRVIPDWFSVDRATCTIVDRHIQHGSQALRNHMALEIACRSLGIEKILRKPQDIEWCVARGKLWFLQSRPITSFSRCSFAAPRRNPIVRGLGASPGLARGRVSVVLSPKQLNKVKEADILVTVMTNPFFVGAMQKAKAIVTDVGGMICHAAIIARELGIPCVVGTKRATTALRDDMEVVVDGTGGTVHVVR